MYLYVLRTFSSHYTTSTCLFTSYLRAIYDLYQVLVLWYKVLLYYFSRIIHYCKAHDRPLPSFAVNSFRLTLLPSFLPSPTYKYYSFFLIVRFCLIASLSPPILFVIFFPLFLSS